MAEATLRAQCTRCHHEHLVDEVLPEQPIRQLLPGMTCIRAMQEQLPRVLSFPFQLRFLFASRPQLMGRVLGIVYRAISSHLNKKSGFTRKTTQTGAVTLIQRYGSALTKSPGAILNSQRLARRVKGRMPEIISMYI